MLVRQFVPGRKKISSEKSEASPGCIIFVITGILLAVAGIKIFEFFKTEPPAPIFAAVPGLVITTSVEEAERISRRTLLLPQETFGAEIEAIGFYPRESPELPAASMSIVLSKNGWRFVEILERPGLSLEEAITVFPEPHQPIRVNQQLGYLVILKTGEPKCSLAEDERLGVCEITKVLLFEHNSATVSIGADGTSVTEGELIEMARSIVGEDGSEIEDLPETTEEVGVQAVVESQVIEIEPTAESIMMNEPTTPIQEQ